MMSRGQGLQMKSSRSISAVLAGYNEESNIDRSMGMLYDSLENHFEKFELILIGNYTYMVYKYEFFHKPPGGIPFIPFYYRSIPFCYTREPNDLPAGLHCFKQNSKSFGKYVCS